MKIGIVSFIAPYTMPYLNTYLNIIKDMNAECDLIFWDRDGNAKDETIDGIHYVPYTCIAPPEQSMIIRDLKYIPVARFIIKKLKSNNYDRVIFLQTHAAVLCARTILKKYERKYIVDIRDFTLENISFYKKIEKKVIDNSYFTVISSEGYKEFLPENKYVIAHNFTEASEEMINKIVNKEKYNHTINISFIGYVRFYDMAKKLLLKFSNDERFKISYIGTGANALEQFCVDNNINNVVLYDRFEPSETIKFYQECDLINNLYGNNDKYLDYALSNKLYYAAQLQIPVLVSENTYSSEVASKYNIGISWNPDEEDAVDKLYDAYSTFDFKKMKIDSKKFLDKVITENKEYENKIKQFLNQ
ncbi:hypothetical protein [Dorea sp.]